jgi:uncharacterized FAD-dependent dehydrogenase
VNRRAVLRIAGDLFFNVVLAVISELVVQVTGWSRLPVLLVVFAVGHAGRAVYAAVRRRFGVHTNPEEQDGGGRRSQGRASVRG